VTPLDASRSPRVRREYADIQAAMARVPASAPAFDATAYDLRAVARVRARWSSQLLSEYRSAFVFSALAGQIAEAGAPIDMVAVTLRMAQDELRHSHTCAGVVRALGADPVLPVLERAPGLALHAGESRRQRALRNVLLTTCISEMHAVASFVASLDVMTDPHLRVRTRAILADEVLHGELGFAYAETAQEWLRNSAGEREAIATYLRFAFAWAERELVRPPCEPSDDELALGVPPADVVHDLYATTMRGAVVPALELLGIAAEDAWNRRALA
jgi:hypothetical protein